MYNQKFNRKHHRVGYVFQGRYKAILVDKDAYLLEVGRYILLSPIRANMVNNLEEYLWRSWPHVIGVSDTPDWLSINQTLIQFGDELSKAREAYHRFVLDGVGKRCGQI